MRKGTHHTEESKRKMKKPLPRSQEWRDKQIYGSTDTDVWLGTDGLTEQITIEEAAKAAREFSKKPQ